MIKMNNTFRKFLINNLILTLILTIFGTLLFGTLFTIYFQPVFLLLIVLGLSVNLFVFNIALNNSKSVNQSFFIVVSSFAIKFISYLAFTVIYFLINKEIQERVVYIIVLFFIFITYTSLEIKALTKIFKTNKGN
jgi:hypothetical protein